MRQHSPAIVNFAKEPDSRRAAPGKCRQTLNFGYEKKINAVAFSNNIRDAMTQKPLVMSDGVFVPYATINRIRVGSCRLNLSSCDVSRAIMT